MAEIHVQMRRIALALKNQLDCSQAAWCRLGATGITALANLNNQDSLVLEMRS
jgi:hypothetical protein